MDISPQIREFIRLHVRAVWQLELLLLLKAASREITATQAANELYLRPEAVEKALMEFEKQGLLNAEGGNPRSYFYAPSNSSLDDGLEQLARAYRERRFAVINLIFQSQATRNRTTTN